MSLLIRSEKIWVATRPVDFRRAIDGLCAHVVESFQAQPQEGLFIFYNGKRNRLKMLVWHHNGFMLVYKRLERGRFPFRFSTNETRTRINENQLQALLLGVDWQSISEWKEVNFSAYA